MVGQQSDNVEEIENLAEEAGTDQIATDQGIEGIIYVLENEAFTTPVIKIGMVKSVEASALRRRISGLNTAVPLPFVCRKASRVADVATVEKTLHQTFQHAQHRWRGEFFEIEAQIVARILEWRELEDVTHFAPDQTDEEKRAIEETAKVKERAANFSFQALGISVGEPLHFADDTNKSCTVSSLRPPKVKFEGEEQALSKLTATLKGWNVNHVQVQPYWLYKGETLKDRLARLESEAAEDSV